MDGHPNRFDDRLTGGLAEVQCPRTGYRLGGSMRLDLIKRLQRILILVIFIVFSSILLILAQEAGYALPSPGQFLPALPVDNPPKIALISGHAGYDSGAVCTDGDGELLLSEAVVNAKIAAEVALLLRKEGYDVDILEEYDARLDNLKADALLSLHIDSCVAQSGYKAATRMSSVDPDADGRLLACIDEHYPAGTALRYHPNTITHDMTAYHAFRKVDPLTPIAILEMGFLGGDQALLVEQTDVVATAIKESLLCFLEPTSETNDAAPE